MPDKWSEGYEFALSLVTFKCQEGLTDEDRKTVADWREKHWKDTKQAGLIPPTRTVCTFFRVKFNDTGETYGLTQATTD